MAYQEVPAVKAGKFSAYMVTPTGVRYGDGLVGPPPSFAAGRFVEYSDKTGGVRFGDYGGRVVTMDQGIPGNVRFGTGL